MQAAAAELLQQLVRAIPHVVDGSEDLRGIAHRVMDLFWAQMVSDELNVLAQFEIGMWAKRNPHHGDLSRSVYSDYEKEISKLLIAAAKRGNQDQTISARNLARALIVIMDGCSLQYFADPSDPRHKDLCDNLVDAYLDKVGL
ncbi:putative TetR family transcriptional regulator [Arthrobacter nitrophenolicus]|nr:putative TetR family transcriptional regulator [Arthrobacter nitrophenolicus]